MTTMVTVEASSHDVEIEYINPKDGKPIGPKMRVAKGNKSLFYAHSGQDVAIAEVKDS